MSKYKYVDQEVLAQDVMSSAVATRVTIPPFGAVPGDEVKSALKAVYGNCNLDDIKADIDFDCLCHKFGLLEKPGSEDFAKERSEPLSEESYRLSLAKGVITLEALMDGDDRSTLVATAIRIGRTVEQLEMRRKNLGNATRGKKVQDGASRAGNGKRGWISTEAAQTVLYMRKLVEQNRSISDAAERAAGKRYGKSKEANRKLFYRYKEKSLGHLLAKCPNDMEQSDST